MTYREDCAAVRKLKEAILSDFFMHSILYILDDCIHQIYISHCVFPLFTFVTELMATLGLVFTRRKIFRS